KEFSNSPHPFGSSRQKELAAYLSVRAKSLGFNVIESPFTANTPNPLLLEKPAHPAPARIKREGRNIFAWRDSKDATCAVLVGSHYDTKEIEGVTFVGANDSGSTSALLLQILSSVTSFQKSNKLDCLVIGAWFDGEESTLPDWR